MQKNHTYTVIQYADAFNEKQMLIFDFKGKLKEAQPMIYNRMVASRSARKQVLDSTENFYDDRQARSDSEINGQKVSQDNKVASKWLKVSKISKLWITFHVKLNVSTVWDLINNAVLFKQ